MLFDFLSMGGNYEERKVDRFEKGRLVIDTCAVADSDQSFETAVGHPKYNKGDWVVVEMYDSRKEAQIGHKKWIKKMTAKNLPKELADVSTAETARLCDSAYGGENWRNIKKGGVRS